MESAGVESREVESAGVESREVESAGVEFLLFAGQFSSLSNQNDKKIQTPQYTKCHSVPPLERPSIFSRLL